ncbi:hypothetical protein FA13DRAFT_29241 [Coprinellus micaceus]|uniref:BED-type domain-containing protein n=1 Tax=Coprinellus micaceus TaxID=71717 RepID=A0A4Y7U1Y3_COPMI|nr:hypothetical protein FA13DRAFT_29241 [Coprinellus micaceus]
MRLIRADNECPPYCIIFTPCTSRISCHDPQEGASERPSDHYNCRWHSVTTRVDQNTGKHVVQCDICGEDIILTVTGDSERLDSHRRGRNCDEAVKRKRKLGVHIPPPIHVAGSGTQSEGTSDVLGEHSPYFGSFMTTPARYHPYYSHSRAPIRKR